MHYYEHNIADYRKDTTHLSILEHGIYRQLLDSYYLSEEPLCGDDAKLMRSHSVRNTEEMQAFKNVLADFFIKTESGYIHTRCDKTIAVYHAKSELARQSAKARWSSRTDKTDANALRTDCDGNANHKPITNNHKPIKDKKTTPEGDLFFGVPNQVVVDFKAMRAKQRATITKTVINGIEREASKAGITLTAALTLCCERSWRSFKAEWIADKTPYSLLKPEKFDQLAYVNRNREIPNVRPERDITGEIFEMVPSPSGIEGFSDGPPLQPS